MGMEIQNRKNIRVSKRILGLEHQHKLKQSKLARANPNRLSYGVIQNIIDFCISKIETRPEVSLVLLVILSGRDIKNIMGSLQNLESELNGEKQNSLYLTTDWPFPKRNSNLSNSVLFQNAQNTAYLPIPIFLEDALKKVLSFIVDNEEANRMTNQILAEMNRTLDCKFQKITLAKIESILPAVAHQFDISRTELAIIRNREYDKYSSTSYGIGVLQPLVKKYYKFIESILKEHLLFCPLVDSSFGSNLTLSDIGVISIFQHFSDQIQTRPVLVPDKIQKFNAVTNYVVSYLELCTMHRPIKRQFGELNHFDLTTGFALVRDKGFDSQRTLPLPPSAVVLIKKYCQYIAELRDTLIFTHKHIADELDKMLHSETNLFKHWVRSKLDDYNPRRRFNKALQLESIPKNWARHYVKTKLVEIGLSSDDIELFMSHHAEHENLYSILSTYEFERFSMISDVIENQIIKPLNLSTIKW